MTDIKDHNSFIDILIGADVTGKLIMRRKYNLKNSLIAFKTRLEWTMMGKLLRKSKRVNTAVMITTLFVQKAELSDLWSLDVIDILDSIEKSDKSVRDEQTRAFLIKTVKMNNEGRYEVRIP